MSTNRKAVKFALLVSFIVLTSCGSEDEASFCYDLPLAECGDYSQCKQGLLIPWNDANSCWDRQKSLCVPKGFGTDPNTGCAPLGSCAIDPDGQLWSTGYCEPPPGWTSAGPGECKQAPDCE